MALTDVFQKTVKGTAELTTRSVKLAPMTRMALVMVDGIKSVSDLAGKLGGEAGAQTALQELLTHGLIAPGAAPAAAPVSVGPITAAATAAGPMGLDDLRKWAARHVSAAMGPMGDDYTMRIERAKTMEELVAAAEKARNAIGSFTTRTKEQAFWEQFEKHRGA